jgi:hypothetical protein
VGFYSIVWDGATFKAVLAIASTIGPVEGLFLFHQRIYQLQNAAPVLHRQLLHLAQLAQ